MEGISVLATTNALEASAFAQLRDDAEQGGKVEGCSSVLNALQG
jgi:hypothetical protein